MKFVDNALVHRIVDRTPILGSNLSHEPHWHIAVYVQESVIIDARFIW